MSYESTAQACEAYVIESDGSRRSIPVNFANNVHTQGFHYKNASEEEQAHPIAAFLHRLNNSDGQRKTTLATRILGGVLVLLGIPMLILPGPGIASIIIGLALLLRH